jgi:methionyl-tRNA formyltransferase
LLSNTRHTVPLVLTHPQSRDPYETIWNDSVRETAEKARIDVIECRYAKSSPVLEAIARVAPDVIVASNWRTILSSEVLSIPRLGGLNIHDALLPKYGGFAPINWAIINGETEVGLTVHLMDKAVDLGDIVVQKRIPVAFTDTTTIVMRRVFDVLADITLEALDRLETEGFCPTPQDPSQATFFQKRSDGDSRIDWSQSNIAIYNLIRAQSDPYPNAFAFHDGRCLRIKRASIPEQTSCGSPGRVLCRHSRGVVVLCGQPSHGANQSLVLEQVQPQGGEVMPADRYFRTLNIYLD